jgi:hypothetical protein
VLGSGEIQVLARTEKNLVGAERLDGFAVQVNVAGEIELSRLARSSHRALWLCLKEDELI